MSDPGVTYYGQGEEPDTEYIRGELDSALDRALNGGRKYSEGGIVGPIKAYRNTREEKKPDNVNSPPHYIFPGGVETIHLSRHLTSNGGQAVQYIARATRLDGNIKGDPVEDLEKAIVFLQDEVERLRDDPL